MSKQSSNSTLHTGPSPQQTGLVFFENRTADTASEKTLLSVLPSSAITASLELAQFKLILSENNLSLQINETGAPGAINADFITGKARYRLGQGELIYRAMGLSRIKNPRILDATAGLGRDAFVLASKGCDVTLIERTPLIYLLLRDAIERATHHSVSDDIVKRMKVIHCDAVSYMQSDNTTDTDIVYLDPMYPERKKSALVKKEMQVFQSLLGKQETAVELLPLAIARAKHRVVIKRPRKGEFLNGLKPDYSINGKHVRFDVHIAGKPVK